MKKIIVTLGMFFIALSGFSQSYVYTAQSSGLWTLASIWTKTPRTDGINKNKVVIPNYIIIYADNNVNNLDLDDVEVFVYGTLVIMPGTNLQFSENSSIDLISGTLIGLSANQKIKIGSDIKYKGNVDGILSGTYRVDKTTSGFVSFTTLPVNFTSFYITKSGQKLKLDWSTDREVENSHFEVERSYNGTDWKKIARISGAGNTNNSNNYSYNDENGSSSIVYYRLRQVDLDGNSVYSSIKSIRNGETISPVKIYGSDKRVVIDLNTAAKNNLVVSVLTTNGQMISRHLFSNPGYNINVQLNHILPGIYIVQVTDNAGWTEVKKVIL